MTALESALALYPPSWHMTAHYREMGRELALRYGDDWLTDYVQETLGEWMARDWRVTGGRAACSL